MFVRRPTSVGIFPVKRFVPINETTLELIFEDVRSCIVTTEFEKNAFGNIPILSFVNFVRRPISVGIVPSNKLKSVKHEAAVRVYFVVSLHTMRRTQA